MEKEIKLEEVHKELKELRKEMVKLNKRIDLESNKLYNVIDNVEFQLINKIEENHMDLEFQIASVL
ncbi:hypothetical protein ACWOA6_05845 [Globicatella sulfidifaciens]|uniref:Uncharacterized protein n=1 Tax=Globicatella sulfidifaciens DSM 15739 TaxID=1121925 RepID=A0A1T4LA15_9LACT|nr:hypothetical protein [Globicatella sulfidifaciens]SJZ51536.1 hypothetical protein SAMN02746011_01013 [Globicatella sulfidifaciens DSM 15739]